MKVHLINKIFLLAEVMPLTLLLLLAFTLSGDTRPVFFITLTLSILSIVSLIYIIVMTIVNKAKSIANRYIHLTHIGVLITILGLLSILGGSNFKSHSPEAPFAIFSFGLIAFIPYLHVMFINHFFRWRYDEYSDR